MQTRLSAGIAFALALSLPPVANAQNEADWQFQGAIYGYLPTMSTYSKIPPAPGGNGVVIDGDAILNSLEFAFMGNIDARKGRFGVYADIIGMDLQTNQTGSRAASVGDIGLPVGASADLDLGLKGAVLTLAGYYRAQTTPTHTLDLLAGARMLDLKQSVNWQFQGNVASIPVPDRSGNHTVEVQNWDAIAGVKGRFGLGADNAWFVPYYLDMGAGASKFTWQAMTGLGYSASWGDVIAAWRYTDYQMKDGKVLEELNLSGPAIAAVFHW